MRVSLPVLLAAALVTGCAGADSDGELVGPRGGIVESDDGLLRVEIRENALEEHMVIAVAPTPCEDLDAVACYAFEPWGVMLRAPAWVVFDGDAMQMPSDSLLLQVEGAEGYVPMSDANYDAEDGTAWASVMFLTSVTVTVAP